MELMFFKGFWDQFDKKVIRPIYQEIQFENSKNNSFSFKVMLNETGSIHQNNTSNWSKTIPSGLYKEGEKYDVSIKFYYNGLNNTFIETCKYENYLKYTLDTSSWLCLSSSVTNPNIIDIKRVCDGIPNCDDLSDEEETMCKPDFSYFNMIVYSLEALYFVFGCLIFFIVQKLYHPPMLKVLIAPELLSKKINREKRKQSANSQALLGICRETEAQNHGHQEELAARHKQQIRHVFVPCQHDVAKRPLFKLLFSLALIKKYTPTAEKIFDEMFKLELEVHGTKGQAMRCMRFEKSQDSYLSKFIKDEIERNDFFSKLGRTINSCLQVFDYGNVLLYISITIELLLVLINIVVFFYDIVKDITTILLLAHIQDDILGDEDIRNKFITVGGINFQVLIAYLCIVLVISETGIVWHINTRRSVLNINIHSKSRLEIAGIKVFPVHFVYLRTCTIKIKVLVLQDKLKHMLKTKELFLTKDFQEKQAANTLAMLADNMEELHYKLYHLNLLKSEIQILQSLFEREPQTVVQITLLILMMSFPRLSLLFTAYFGTSMEVIVLVVALSALTTILSITKSVYRYYHSKEYPIAPSIFGAMAQCIGIMALVVPKYVLISITLLNAYYIHPLFYLVNLNLIFLYDKIVSHSRTSNHYQLLARMIAPVFYSPSTPYSENTFLRAYIFLREKFGIVVHTATFQLANLVVFSITASVLRSTIFDYNIETTYHTDDEAFISKPNPTMPTFLANRSKQEENEFKKELFDDSLHKFPLYYAVAYTGCLVLSSLFFILFYTVCHPWKIVIRDKTPNDNIHQNSMEMSEDLEKDVEDQNRALEQNAKDEPEEVENESQSDVEEGIKTFKEDMQRRSKTKERLSQRREQCKLDVDIIQRADLNPNVQSTIRHNNRKKEQGEVENDFQCDVEEGVKQFKEGVQRRYKTNARISQPNTECKMDENILRCADSKPNVQDNIKDNRNKLQQDLVEKDDIILHVDSQAQESEKCTFRRKTLPQLQTEIVNHKQDDSAQNISVLLKDKNAATSKLDVCMNIEQPEVTAMRNIVGNQLGSADQPNDVATKL